MHPIPRALLLGLLLSLSAPAFAVYKCESDKKVSYSDIPCPDAKVLDIGGAASPDAAHARQQATQEKKKLTQLEAARHKMEAKEEKERQQAARANAAARKTCAKLALRKKWADEDAASATGKSAVKAKQKARRAAEQHQSECANG